MKWSLLLEDGLAVLALAAGVGMALYPVMSIEPERGARYAARPLPERCKFPEKVEGCGDQQWIVQGCEPFEGPTIVCVNADLTKRKK